MYALESPDAQVAFRTVYANRRAQTGDVPSHTTRVQRTSKPYEHARPPKKGLPSLGAGAFWKDVELRRREDGTVIAVPSHGLDRVGRTIYGRGKATGSERRIGTENRTAARRAKTEKSHMDPSLRRLAEVEREEVNGKPVYTSQTEADVFWAGQVRDVGYPRDEWAVGGGERAGTCLSGEGTEAEVEATEAIFEMYIEWGEDE